MGDSAILGGEAEDIACSLRDFQESRSAVGMTTRPPCSTPMKRASWRLRGNLSPLICSMLICSMELAERICSRIMLISGCLRIERDSG